MTSSSGYQSFMLINGRANQTGSGGYTGLLVNMREDGLGSGEKNLIDLQVGGVRKYEVTNDGTANYYSTRTDASNYERLSISGDGTIATEAAGTGTQADIVLNGANRAAHITDVSSGTDTAYETAINAILVALETHGITATS